MNYELAKELKDAGFPQLRPVEHAPNSDEPLYIPTLEELIDACGEGFFMLIRRESKGDVYWFAQNSEDKGFGKPQLFPLIAVANLYLELNKK